ASMRLAFFYGDYAYAPKAAQEIYDLYTELGDEQGITFAQVYLGYLDLLNGNPASAEARWQEALRLAKGTSIPAVNSFVHFFLGNFYVSIPAGRNLELARQHTEHGLMIARPVGNVWMMSLNLIVLAYANLLENNLSVAQTQFEECISLSQALKDRRGGAAARNGLAKIALLEGFPQRGQAIYADNLRFFYEINYKAGM